MPLRPVVLDEELYYQTLEKLLAAHPKKFLVGLNNLGQVAFSRDLAKRCSNTFSF